MSYIDSYFIEQYSSVKKGDLLLKNGNIEIYADKDGIVFENRGSYLLELPDYETFEEKYAIFSDYAEILDSTTFHFSSAVEKDVVTGDVCISLNSKVHDIPFIHFTFPPVKFILEYRTPNNYIRFRVDRSKIKIKKGDSFSFIFEDQSVLTYQIAEQPAKDKRYDFYRFPIYKEDIDLFFSKKLTYCQINFSNGNDAKKSEFYIEGVPPCEGASNVVLLNMLNDYLAAIEANGILLTSRSISTESSPQNSDQEACSVYLMMDISNGYYKIGISNKPQYREHTLQSEKPTIELVCSKEYPHRKIAEAIEKALHSAFAEKRIRGEWFNLDEKDLLMLIGTLK